MHSPIYRFNIDSYTTEENTFIHTLQKKIPNVRQYVNFGADAPAHVLQEVSSLACRQETNHSLHRSSQAPDLLEVDPLQ